MTSKEIFLVPYAHLDTQWRWEFPTTIRKYIRNTLEQNFALFDKYPEHEFNFTGALRYAMMKEYYPAHYETLKKLIAENRWHLAGTSLDETDALTPSVESMIRNILYGDQWFQQEFGKSSRDYMIPDCFGFPANMPSVLAHCGIHGFSSQKLTWNSAVGIPFELGMWKGPDEKEVVCALNPGPYVSRILLPVHLNPARLKQLNTLGKKNGIWKSFQYYGVGDIGGAPTEGSVKRALGSIKHGAQKGTALTVRQGTPDQFFAEVTEAEKQRMDRYSGDLLLINHSAGTLTSAAIMKRWNRKNEQLAFAAEAAALTAHIVAQVPYPEDKIESAWYRVIGSQMHDILPGTCTPTAYEYSHNDEVIALKTWTTIIHDAAQAIAPFVPGEGTVLLYNPLGETRQDLVEINLPIPSDFGEKAITLVDTDGNTIPVQIHDYEGGQKTAIFIPKLPPFSWKRYSIEFNSKTTEEEILNPVRIDRNEDGFILENSYYKILITQAGQIFSIFHKEMQKELLKKPLAYEFQKEHPKVFPAWNMDWKDRKKPPFLRIETGDEVSIIEDGPLRCILQITTHINSSVFLKEISLSHESDIIKFTERISWRELGCSLKLALTGDFTQPQVTYNW
ncbi:MAG: hypothetical protein E4G98_01705 [Promethearchaeota archaeon]|nr:MAG: hypothetical protein E4G98_01705 [Candidatus Lokiarchaeota archaeon]